MYAHVHVHVPYRTCVYNNTNQADEPAAATLVVFPEFDSQELEVDVFEQEQQRAEEHAHRQQDEGRREVADSERNRL